MKMDYTDIETLPFDVAASREDVLAALRADVK